MAQQLVDFGALVGAQLAALIDAEASAAERTTEFIERVGFEPREAGAPLRVRTVTFSMTRRDVDGEVRAHLIEVPVLSIVPIPLLSIEEANLDFDLQVESIETEKSQSDDSSETIPRSRFFGSVRPKLMTRIARTAQSDTKTRFDLKVSVKVRQSGLPLGIERLLNLADLAVTDRPE